MSTMLALEDRASACAYHLRVTGHDEENIVKEAYRRGALSQNAIDIKRFRDRLTEMQGEYISLELINDLIEEFKQ